jgi:hypothetical protein
MKSLRPSLAVLAAALMLAAQPAFAQNFDPAQASSPAEKEQLTRMVLLCKDLREKGVGTNKKLESARSAYDKDPSDANVDRLDMAERADFEVRYQLQQNRCSERPQNV